VTAQVQQLAHEQTKVALEWRPIKTWRQSYVPRSDRPDLFGRDQRRAEA
jgi:hypothetical protein